MLISRNLQARKVRFHIVIAECSRFKLMEEPEKMRTAAYERARTPKQK